MILFALAALLLLASLAGVTLEKAYFYLPVKELGRRAARGDKISEALHRVAVYDGELRILLIVLAVATAASGLVLFATVAPFIFGLLVTALALALCFFWQPRTRLTPVEAKLAMWCSPALVWVLRQSHPLISSISFHRHLSRRHTGLYELADIEELFERQARQRDNRVRPAELARLRNILHAGSCKVRDTLIPPKKVVVVSAEETISPVLVNELHRTGYTRFPVYEDTKTNIIGTLALADIADVKQHGLVSNNTDHHLAYLHEDDSLEQALRAFYETHQQLFIVVNDKGEYAGIVTISDVLKRLLGNLENVAFGKHEDHDAVVNRHAGAQSIAKSVTEVVQ